MAEALVSFLITQIADVIQKEIEQKVRLVVGVDSEVVNLANSYEAIRRVLNDAKQRQTDEDVKSWLDGLTNVSYDMEDVLDEWRTAILRSQVEALEPKVVSSYLFSPFSCFPKVYFRHDIAIRVKEIRLRLEFFASEKNKYNFVQTKPSLMERPKTSSINVDPDIVGRGSEKKTILNKLLGVDDECSTSYQENETRDARIISILGMGGLGKTTLARLVYNDKEVKDHFDKNMWVCVSDSFDLIRITKAIIQEATQKITNSSEWNALHKELCDSVNDTRFLLVLDDVWTEDPSNWSPLKDLL